MPYFERDGIRFHYQERGRGYPFCFQHGLGGDVNQTFSLLNDIPGIHLLTLDCRGHGDTYPLGDPDTLRMSVMADDLIAFLDHLGYSHCVVGGISMGAALALNVTVRYPKRVTGLVLSRPAWLAGAAPPNLAIYTTIARLIREHGSHNGREIFSRLPEYQAVLLESPDAAASLLGQFDNPRAEEAVLRLERIPNDAPIYSMDMLVHIQVPCLVMASREDPIHPYEYGQRLAQAIPGAIFRELTPKSRSKEQHAQDVQAYIQTYLHDLLSIEAGQLNG